MEAADTVAEVVVEKTNLDTVSSSSGSENLDSSYSDVSSRCFFILVSFFCFRVCFLKIILNFSCGFSWTSCPV